MMKSKNIFLGLGWVLFFGSLISGSVFNKFSGEEGFAFTPIGWEEHVTVLQGALTCSLTSEELIDRKLELKSEIFVHLKNKVELEDGYIYYFEDKKGLIEKITEFMLKEKQCCPFFKFDLSILPFEKGLAFRISGSKEVKDFLFEFEKEL